MTYQPKDQLSQGPMTALQYRTIFICFLMNMLDGMDVTIISFTAPAIADNWMIKPAALGAVFSSGLVGMSVGAIFLAPYADRIGRKPMMLLAACLMASCIYLTAFATGIQALMACRFFSGLGIGAMLACTAALTAEYTPDKTRDFWVSVVISGYPAGAVLLGIYAAPVIREKGWEHLFTVAGILSALALPMIYFFASESLDYLLKSSRKQALEKANRLLQRMRMPLLEELPVPPVIESTASGPGTLFNPSYRRPTLQLWIALFLAFSTLYFLISWIPRLATNAGISMELAIYAGTVFNLGATLGIWVQGYVSGRWGLRKTVSAILVLTALVMLGFGLFSGSLMVLFAFFLLGFGIQGGFVGLYAVAARMYPTRIRATGLGWAIGMGRLGGIIGPILGGFLVAQGLSMSQNFMAFAVLTALSGWMTFRISSRNIS